MTNSKEIITKYKEATFTKNLVNNEFIDEIQKTLSISIGAELQDYIKNVGYLGYGHIEFLGINSIQGINSDMIKCTSELHKTYPSTNNFTAIENSDGEEFILVDGKDNIFDFEPGIDSSPKSLNIKLFSYIEKRFNNAK